MTDNTIDNDNCNDDDNDNDNNTTTETYMSDTKFPMVTSLSSPMSNCDNDLLYFQLPNCNFRWPRQGSITIEALNVWLSGPRFTSRQHSIPKQDSRMLQCASELMLLGSCMSGQSETQCDQYLSCKNIPDKVNYLNKKHNHRFTVSFSNSNLWDTTFYSGVMFG